MSVQDKIERILKEIHLLFSGSEPYDGSEDRIIVEKQKVFSLLQQLNLAVYEVMDEYEVIGSKRELSERRSEKRGEELIEKANKRADDIYAASIMYTDDALNRIYHIMDDADRSVQKIFQRMNADIEYQKDRLRRNQSELTEQLQDFADTKKYMKLIEEQNRQLEKELQEQETAAKEKRIQNEGKSYSAVQPEIKINKAYFERVGKSLEITDAEEARNDNDRLERAAGKEFTDSLARVTGKEFADNLRRRAAKDTPWKVEVEDLSLMDEKEPEPVYSRRAVGMDIPDMVMDLNDDAPLQNVTPEVRVDLDAEYFKWKEAGEGAGKASQEKKERRFPFGKK